MEEHAEHHEHGEHGEDGQEPVSLWEQVLAEHRENSSAAKARDVYQLMVVGSGNDGKEHVFKWLRMGDGSNEDEEDLLPPIGLGFGFGEWTGRPVGEDEDSTIRILYTLVESTSVRNLLPAYFLSGSRALKNIETTLFAITIDLSAPHCIFDTLETWYKEIEKVVEAAVGQDGAETLEKMRDALNKECDNFHTDPTLKAKKTAEVDDCLEVISPRKDNVRASAAYRKMGIFTKGNLGVPLLVIGTKAKQHEEYAAVHTKDKKDRDLYLNYMQVQIRKWCIERGAALVYTDGERAASSRLKDYLLFRLGGIPTPTQVDERNALVHRNPPSCNENLKVFFPASADSLGQVAKMPQGRYAEQKWEDAVPAPPAKKEAEGKEADVPLLFSEWLANKVTSEPNLAGSLLGESRPVRPKTDVDRKLRELGDSRGKPKSANIEKTAEAFFDNMMKTYKSKAKKPRGPSP